MTKGEKVRGNTVEFCRSLSGETFYTTLLMRLFVPPEMLRAARETGDYAILREHLRAEFVARRVELEKWFQGALEQLGEQHND